MVPSFGVAPERRSRQPTGMRSRAEIVLKWMAGIAALLGLAAMGLALTGAPAAVWPALAFLYLTGVGFGLGEMTRLYQRHRRRCRECLEGAGPHLRWWGVRVALVLVVSALPVLLLLPMVSNLRS